MIVHVHGGSMKEGSGNIIRPDYFVAQDLVVVTFNYRLGHLGFFSLDNDLAPGNAGMKDMVAALRWVNENIRAFGGDPDKVTLQGCSSAAAAVHWLMLLPDTEGAGGCGRVTGTTVLRISAKDSSNTCIGLCDD